MQEKGTNAEVSLLTPLARVPFVGRGLAEKLEKLKLRVARDLLYFFPRRYIDLIDVEADTDLPDGAVARLRGVVVELVQRTTANGGAMLGVLFKCGTRHVRGLWFNQPYRHKEFKPGQEVLLRGRVAKHIGIWEMTHPHFEFLTPLSAPEEEGLAPVYRMTEGVTQEELRRVIAKTIDACATRIEEVLPDAFRQPRGLLGIHKALSAIHFPKTREELEIARRRFVYQELLVLQLALGMQRRRRRDEQKADPLLITPKIDTRIRRLFPFALTKDQNRAIEEIAGDLGRSYPMNRMLQGEVGSGKTVVALYAMLLAVAEKHQAVLMAPTEILARQHAQTLEKYLAASKVRWRVLTGGSTAAERRETLAAVAEGTLDVLIGTQALVQSDVQYSKLGLVVIDEQQKFGVKQRAVLKRAGVDPHYLVMTATPIPRTVAMAQFGDLDVSTLRDTPIGRLPTHTYQATGEQRAKWFEFISKKLREGRQGYWVLPRVEEDEASAVRSVEAAFEQLSNGPLEAFRLGLLHGRLSLDEKMAALEAFQRGETQVLVSTNVVEVGIDVPNATLMTIESGERFGLAQLHQLRGRIARGAHPGYCCVFADDASKESQARLEAFTSITDGFRLSEIDLELRGPGSLLGARQHGMPPLRIANLSEDAAILDEARRDAQMLLNDDNALKNDEFALLRRMVMVRFGNVLELGDVG